MFKRSFKRKTIIILAGLLWPFCGISQTVLYVSTRGNDVNSGAKYKPLQSIQKAVSRAKSIKGPVIIKISGGFYSLAEPIVFIAKDSRQDGETLTLSNLNNEKVVVTGSALLNKLVWTPYKNGIWQTHLNQDLIYDELFVNGQRQQMARYPNFDASARFLSGTSSDAVSKERAAHWHAPAGGYIHALHRSEWGDMHYRITGKKDNSELNMEGGWQNNRRSSMHPQYRFVENIFEELDTANEWYYDKAAKTLYYMPPKGLDLSSAKFETPQIPHLFEFKGTEAAPVKNITISGLTLTGTLRTFMENKEPLLRSDWTIYRGGAVLYQGAVNCAIKNCTLTNLGGNAIFFSNYNRNNQVSDCLISEIGASAICFVGDPNAVRSPSFEYNQFVPLAQIDRVAGPKTNNYPANCKVYDNLMFNLGLVEKQSAGVELSMSQSITVSHNTIYDVPRAGINVSEGTWGGHIIEYNDVFNTVKESGDHGSFNSWGRDRFWHPNKQTLDSIVATNYSLALADVVKPIILRNNRMRCDHGWDIDLDDGSSNYIIYNNLCLNGGIKLREGVNRVVENNIMVNNTFHPHVWFQNGNDVFRHNIVLAGYLPVNIKIWGKEVDYNLLPDSIALNEAHKRGTDKHSVMGNPFFVNPKDGDFQVQKRSPALTIGFENFPMDNFGVVSPKLKTMAKKVELPAVMNLNTIKKDALFDFAGAQVKNLSTPGEQSATGMDGIRGVIVTGVSPASVAARFLQVNDVILSFSDKPTNNVRDLLEGKMSLIGSSASIIVFRNQKELKQIVTLNK
jgi:hypothetical protein